MNARRILVINSGSSSIKFKVFDRENEVVSGIIERIGNSPMLRVNTPKKIIKRVRAKNHERAMDEILHLLNELGIGSIDAVGHRVVHGGTLRKSCVITKEVERVIEKNSELAPLHNPANLMGIRAAKRLNVPNVAVFDTAFHSTMKEKAFMYGLPFEFYKRYGIRRYGFHGISHKYVYSVAKKMLPHARKFITCHLGNGASITAIKNGRSVDTSMGFTPLEGLMMGTRSGSFDPAIAEFLERKGISASELIKIANKKSGLLGISGISNDVRDLEKSKSPRAKLALEMFSYIAAKTIGSYIAAMNGVDAIVFTAGIGENSPKIRKMICSYFTFSGVVLDNRANARNETVISSKNSKVRILVIKTNEELQIARETRAVLKNHFGKKRTARRKTRI